MRKYPQDDERSLYLLCHFLTPNEQSVFRDVHPQLPWPKGEDIPAYIITPHFNYNIQNARALNSYTLNYDLNICHSLDLQPCLTKPIPDQYKECISKFSTSPHTLEIERKDISIYLCVIKNARNLNYLQCFCRNGQAFSEMVK